MSEPEIKDRIRQTAHDLMMQFGVRSVSMDDIASRMGISKKTIYLYFADKDALVEAVIREQISSSQSCCILYQQQARDAVYEVFLAIEMMQDMFENMHPGVIHDLEKFHPSAFRIFLDHKYTFLQQAIRENIERGIREGLFRDDFEVEVAVKARMETMLMAFNPQVFPKNKFKLVDIETQLTEQYLFGIATRKGYSLILKYKQERLKKSNRNEKNHLA